MLNKYPETQKARTQMDPRTHRQAGIKVYLTPQGAPSAITGKEPWRPLLGAKREEGAEWSRTFGPNRVLKYATFPAIPALLFLVHAVNENASERGRLVWKMS